MSRADLDKEPHEIAAMFDGVAERYDRTNTILSFGRDRAWRKATAAALALRPGERVLDLGAGTGVSTVDLTDSGAYAVGSDISLGMLGVGRRTRPQVPLVAGDALALPFADAAFDAVTISFALRNVVDLTDSGAYAVGSDISLGMLAVGRRTRPQVPLVAGDALALPFADAAFDAVTISFALRNVVDTAGALAEMARVTKPGGRLVVCEFSHPTGPAFRKVYLSYLMGSLPAVARLVAANPDAYVYLAESIRAWPDQRALAELVARSGWTSVKWRNLTGGIAALHRAVRA